MALLKTFPLCWHGSFRVGKKRMRTFRGLCETGKREIMEIPQESSRRGAGLEMTNLLFGTDELTMSL